MAYIRRPPKTKEELLDRMLSHDFNGDLRSVVGEGTSIIREAGNKALVAAPDGRTYEIVVRLPRSENPRGEHQSFSPAGDDEWTVPPVEAAPEPAPRKRQAPGRHQERSRPSPRA